MTQRIEPFPQNDSKFLFFGFDSELIFWLWLLEWYCFVYYDSNKPFFSNTTQRIDFFLIWVTESNTFLNTKELNLLLFSWHKELNFFDDYLTPRFKTFVNREMELFEFGSRNWGLFNNITQKWLTLFGHDSQRWTFFQHAF